VRLDPIIQDENLSGTAAAAESTIDAKDLAFVSSSAKDDEGEGRTFFEWNAMQRSFFPIAPVCVLHRTTEHA